MSAAVHYPPLDLTSNADKLYRENCQLRRRLRAILAAYDADGNGAESLTRLCEEIEASREVCGA